MKKEEQYKWDRVSRIACYHCGEECEKTKITADDKSFCCDGCKLVYDLLKDNSLCTYYNLNSTPGLSQKSLMFSGMYDHLDDQEVNAKLIHFQDEKQAHATFYIPKIHCSSCIWLLENLHKIDHRVISSTVNFLRKEVTVAFVPDRAKLSEIAFLLAHIGYEPLINLNALDEKTTDPGRKSTVIKIGIAGFCFGNIMMLSFPEYFSLGDFMEQGNLKPFFGFLNLFLSLPVFFYCASGFFSSALKSIKYKYLNIDAPIALAILVTFARSVYEILGQTGAGYLDSMSGIVFFMLIGRFFQNKTYETLSFERDYRSYFPLGVTVKLNNGKEVNQQVAGLKKGDRIVVRNNELVPADAMLMSRPTHVDLSFITGEAALVKKNPGELIYAGAKQMDGAIELEVVNPTSQSYLTHLWNKTSHFDETTEKTLVDKINIYFTAVVLFVAFSSLAVWAYVDPAKALNAFTAVLIVACPCGLLLTSTFVNGNIQRIMGRNHFYLKNAAVIEKMSKLDTIVMDKTGTITNGTVVDFEGVGLSKNELELVAALAGQSTHPLSRKIHAQFSGGDPVRVKKFEEVPGQGLKGYVEDKYIVLGSQHFVTGTIAEEGGLVTKTFVMIDGEVTGFFSFRNNYRWGLGGLAKRLLDKYDLKLISGDNDGEQTRLRDLFGERVELRFNSKPEEKMRYVQNLKAIGHKVAMVGDGLNDAGALMQSDVGIAVSDDTNNFSPSCDAIMDGSAFSRLYDFLSLAKAGKKVIIATFLISLIYNLIGLSFAVQGTLSPVVAAILMPVSSISIVLIATISTNVIAWTKQL